ncbi:RHS repeat-associated core domain-containing protein [Streptomyces sp. NPDC048340]|uniref:RHS repeat-associated core domain-containing protein n=1 Tax=Streptomyces sp. NPDC048340 TaxID=3365537 RepID=UPI00371AA4DD
MWGLPESTIEPATSQHWPEDVRTWTTAYDAAGKAVSELLPGNVKRQRTYDGLGRLTGETGSGTAVATRPRTLGYDLVGRMTKAGGAGALSENTYTYNDRGRLLTSDGPGGRSEYGYDADSLMTSRKDAAGTTTFTYDSTARLDTTTDPLTGTETRTDYDAAGRLSLEQYARKNGTQYQVASKRAYTYDSLGRLTKDAVTRTAGGEVQGQTYDYDLADQLVKKTTTGTTGAAANTYTYDQAGRMASWNDGTTNTPYEWDDAGNLTKRGNTTGTYDSRNRLETWGTETYAYSARGTEKTITETADANATRQIQSDAFERTITNGASTFTYDSLDRVMTHNGAGFTYDGGSNNLVTDATTTYTRTPAGTLQATATTTQTGTARLAVTDQHTDLVASLAPDGTTLAASRAYDPFGKTTATDGTNPNLGYQSGWTDTTSGEINMAARWYQPSIGSFTSRDTWQLDPTTSALNANRYTYTTGSPLNATDPTGHMRDRGADGVGTMTGRGSTGYGTLVPNGPTAAQIRAGLWRMLTGSTRSNWAEIDPEAAASGTPGTGLLGGGARSCNHWMCGNGNAPSAAPSLGEIGEAWSQPRGHGTPPPPGRCRSHCIRGTGTPTPPQNPNEPASDLEAGIHWDGSLGIWNPLRDGWSMVLGAVGLSNNGQFEADELSDPFLDEARNPGGDSSRSDDCDDQAGENVAGNIKYLPRERFRPGNDGCRATGIIANFSSPEDARDGTKTITKWKPDCETGATNGPFPADYWDLSVAPRSKARGHLAACQLGGSGSELRNLVPLHRDANSNVMRGVENKVAAQVAAGQAVHYESTPIYPARPTGIPDFIHIQAWGNRGMNIDCYIRNSATSGPAICSSEIYQR